MGQSTTFLRERVFAALARRRPLLADGTLSAVRLLHDQADGLPGLVIEQFGPVLIVQIHQGRATFAPEDLRPVIAELSEKIGTGAVYRKWFVRDRARLTAAQTAEHTCRIPWIGTPAEAAVVVREGPLRAIIRPYDGFSVGLFVEQRENRRRIAGLARGRRVLNCFAYTCGFSVVAAAGGASQVSSVDLSRRYLEWGKENFAASGIDSGSHLFFCSDVLDFFKRARRQGRRFDLVILDPPTFSRARRPYRVFVLAEQLEVLLAGAIELLDPGGLLFFATNNRQLSHQVIEQSLKAAANRRWRIVERPGVPPDFAGDEEYSKTALIQVD